jgi:hypothetical protein
VEVSQAKVSRPRQEGSVPAASRSETTTTDISTEKPRVNMLRALEGTCSSNEFVPRNKRLLNEAIRQACALPSLDTLLPLGRAVESSSASATEASGTVTLRIPLPGFQQGGGESSEDSIRGRAKDVEVDSAEATTEESTSIPGESWIPNHRQCLRLVRIQVGIRGLVPRSQELKYNPPATQGCHLPLLRGKVRS